MRGMHGVRNIVILTGAGISAESGLRTFRADDGLWEDHRVEDVATPQAFARDPELVQRFYDARRENVTAAEPNAAHRALAKLDDGVTVRYLDIGPMFLGQDGKIPFSIMPDQLHPNTAGYQLWADAMQPTLKKMLE